VIQNSLRARLLKSTMIAVLLLAGMLAAGVFPWVFPGSGIASVRAQEVVEVAGRVVNGTDGAADPAGLTVSLHSFATGLEGVNTLETTTSAGGEFRFGEVPATVGLGYALSTDYAGKSYSHLLGREDLTQLVKLTVYEATQDISVIEVNSHAMVIAAVDKTNSLIDAVEVVGLANVSDRTLVPDLANAGPGQFSFLRFSLPPGATGFDIQTDLLGGEIIPVGTGFAVTAPVAPGSHTVTFSFRFPYDGAGISYRQNLLQGAKTYRVLVPQSLGPIRVPTLAAQPPVEIEGVSYAVWQASDVPPGQGVTVEFAGLPRPGWGERAAKAATNGAFWRAAIPVALVVALTAVLVYGGLRPSRVPSSPGEIVPWQGSPGNGVASPRERLVRQVALLDLQFEDGTLTEADYHARRAGLRDEIMAAPPE
jgi:hypothetical protein